MVTRVRRLRSEGYRQLHGVASGWAWISSSRYEREALAGRGCPDTSPSTAQHLFHCANRQALVRKTDPPCVSDTGEAHSFGVAAGLAP
jgi:hypothetical protein